MANIGASTVDYIQGGTGSVLRTLDKRLKDVVSVKDFGAKADGMIDDTTSVQKAITYAFENQCDLYWPKGIYSVANNLLNFHNLNHHGPGQIKCGADTWHIVPTGDIVNILYVSSSNDSTNDGLTPDRTIGFARAIKIIEKIGYKAQDGIWRIQILSGTLTENGIIFYNAPAFRHKLEIWGSRDSNNNITSIWDGALAAAKIAFRADGNAQSLNIHFKDIKFQSWIHADESTNAGALILWENVNIYLENNEFHNCKIGVWLRGGYSKSYGNKYMNCTLWGQCVQYNHTFNIGKETNPDMFTGCGIGVFAARESAGHIDYATFSENRVDIQAHQKTRVASNGGSHSTWRDVAIWLQGDSIFEAGTEKPTFNPDSISDNTPIYRFDNGSSIPAVHTGPVSYRVAHYWPTNAFNLTGTTESHLLSSEAGFGSPLRYPRNMLYNAGTLQIRFEARLNVSGTSGNKLIKLSGPGSSSAYELIAINIPIGGGLGKLYIDIDFREDGLGYASARFVCSVAALYVSTFSTINATTRDLLRAKSEELSLWRLYGQLANPDDSLSLFGMSTYIIG